MNTKIEKFMIFFFLFIIHSCKIKRMRREFIDGECIVHIKEFNEFMVDIVKKVRGDKFLKKVRSYGGIDFSKNQVMK
jgi:hypothetical protein